MSACAVSQHHKDIARAMPSLTLLLDDSNVIGKGIIRIVIHLANMINYMAAGYETRFGMNDSIGGKTRSWSCADQPRRESIVGLEGSV